MKQLLFRIASILFGLVLLEGVSLAILSFEARGFPNLAQLQSERVLTTQLVEPYARDLPEENARRMKVVIHPYVGYIHHKLPNPVHKRSPEKFIIGITGGSIAGGCVAKQAEFIRVLKQHPALADKEIVIVPLAMGGYRQPQQLLMFTHLLSLGAEFDAILNIDGFNEVVVAASDHLEFGMPADFPIDWYFKVRTALPNGEVLGDIGILQFVQKFRGSLTANFSKTPWRFSPTSNLLWRHIDKALARKVTQLQSDVRKDVGSSIEDRPELPNYVYRKRRQIYQYLADLWKRSSIQMKHLADENGIAYYHYLHPNQYIPDSKHLSAEELSTAYSESSIYKPHVEEGYRTLREAGLALKAKGVQYHDLTQIFQDRQDTIYTDSCCHFNDLGFRLMFNEIAQTMLLK